MPTTAALPLARTTSLTGIGFIVFFIASTFSSSPPSDKASDAKWIANYTGTSNQLSHLATGVLLVLAALSLMSFLTGMWRRISDTAPVGTTSPLPLIAGGVATTCIAMGGTVMAYISGSELSNKYPLPSVDLLRLSNDLGFTMTGVPGMAATALCVAVLAHQARRAEIFGRKMALFSWIVAVILLLSFLFVPILALMVWIVVCIINSRRASRTPVANVSHSSSHQNVAVPAVTK